MGIHRKLDPAHWLYRRFGYDKIWGAKASRNRDSLRNLEAAGTADRNGACRFWLNVRGRERGLWAIAEREW